MIYISRIFTASHCIGVVGELSSAKSLIMEATTFPALVVPDVPYDIDAMLMNPTSIRLQEDIRNPDVIIDNIINQLKEKEMDATWLFAVKEFSHADKVAWISSLPDANPGLPAADIFIVPVTMYITVMVKVAETLGGESLYEKKVLEMNLEKCLPG